MSNPSLIFSLEIAKFVFFCVYVAATIGVIVGVYWEGEHFDKATQQRGWRLLVGSLAIDTLFTVLIFGTDGWIGHIQRSEIIALEEKLAPRVPLNGAQISAIRLAAKPFAGQQYALSVGAGAEP